MATTTGRDNGSAKSRKRAPDTDLGFPKKAKIEAKTDPTRWRMKDDDSRHTWHYLTTKKAAQEWPQSYAEKYYLGLHLVKSFSPTCLLLTSN
jgi:lanosterol synthase